MNSLPCHRASACGLRKCPRASTFIGKSNAAISSRDFRENPGHSVFFEGLPGCALDSNEREPFPPSARRKRRPTELGMVAPPKGTPLGPLSTSSVTAARQHPSAYANGSVVGGLERGGRHGLKPMLRPPSTSSVTMASRRLPGSYQPTDWLGDGQTCVVLGLCVGRRLPGRNARTTVVGERRQLNTDNCLRLGRSLALLRETCRGVFG